MICNGIGRFNHGSNDYIDDDDDDDDDNTRITLIDIEAQCLVNHIAKTILLRTFLQDEMEYIP